MKKYLPLNKTFIILSIVVLFSMIMNITLIFNDSVWFDESYSMITLRHGFSDIIKVTASDVHPPLYYFITKCFLLIFGYSVPAAKLSSLCAVFLTMLLGITVIRKRFSTNGDSLFASVIFILMLGFIPCSISENVEVRMYTWAMFFVTASAVFAFEIYMDISRKKNWLLFTLVSICAAYTHYFALATVCIIYAFLLLGLILRNRSAIKYFILVCTISILSYCPWLPVFKEQLNRVSNGFWIPEFTLAKLLEYLQWLFTGPFVNIWLILIMFALLITLSHFMSLPHSRDLLNPQYFFVLFCFLTFAGTIGVGWIMSKLIRPIFVERYSFISMGLLYLFFAYSCSYFLKNKTVKLLILSILICTGVFAYSSQKNQEYDNGTEATKQIMAANISPEDLIATNDSIYSSQEGSPFRYYLPENPLVQVASEEQISQMDSYKKIWYFCNGDFDQSLFDAYGFHSTYIYSGNIDNHHYYTLYLLEKN